MTRYLWHTNAETGQRHRAYRREFSSHLGYFRLFIEDAIQADEWIKLPEYNWYMMANENEKGDVLTAFLWFGPPKTEDPHVIMQVQREYWPWQSKLVSDTGALQSVPIIAKIEAIQLTRHIAWVGRLAPIYRGLKPSVCAGKLQLLKRVGRLAPIYRGLLDGFTKESRIPACSR